MPVTIATKILNYNNNNTEYKTIDAISPPISEGEYMPSDAGITGAHAGDVLYISAVDEDGRPTEYSSTPVFHTMTVHVTNSLGNYISGVSIKIRHNVFDGEVYVADTTTDQPLSFSLPSGFSYYVEFPNASDVGEYFDVQCSNQEGIVQHSNLVCNIIYKGLDEIKTAADIKRALENEVDLSDFVGESITCTKGNDVLVWDIVDYNNDGPTNPIVTIMAHDIVAELPQDAKQAFRKGALAPGNYKFKRNISQTVYYYFTLTQAIPESGQLCITSSSFTTYYSNTSLEPIETGTIDTTELENAIDLGVGGQNDLNEYYRAASWFSNNFAEGGILAWLNSTAEANEPIISINSNDFSRPFVVSIDGFMSGLDPEFLEAISPYEYVFNTNNSYECPAECGGTYSKANVYSIVQYFVLPSLSEIFGIYEGIDTNEEQFELFKDATAEDLIKYDTTFHNPHAWALRTPRWNSSMHINYVERTGNRVETLTGTSPIGIAPIARITGHQK